MERPETDMLDVEMVLIVGEDKDEHVPELDLVPLIQNLIESWTVTTNSPNANLVYTVHDTPDALGDLILR